MKTKLRWAIESVGVTRARLVEITGVSGPSSVSEWLRTGRIAKHHLSAIARETGTTVEWWTTPGAPVPPTKEWLASGVLHVGAPASQTDTAAVMGERSENPNRGMDVTIPQFDTGGAMGDGGLVLRDQPGVIQGWRVSPEWLAKNVKNATAARNLCIVTGFGDSMRPLYNPGDPLIVDRGVTTVDFDAIYFFRVGDEGFVKRLQRVPGQGLVVLSENKSYRDWVIEPTMDFEVFGRVLKIWRGEDF